MTINTNIASLQGQTAIRRAQAGSAQALERLSTGLRINHPADDPAGFIASMGLTSEITKLAAQQTGDDRLYIKSAFADSVLGVVSDVLRQAKSITLQDANKATLNDKQLDANQRTLDAIVDGIERISAGTTFLGERLFGPNVRLASDASGAATSTGDLDPTKIGVIHDQLSGETYSLADLRSGGALADNTNPELADKVITAAIEQIADQRAGLGDFQNALRTFGNIRGVTLENLADALSHIQDADFADETVNLVRNQTLAQTSIAATAIANSQPRRALALLG